MTTPPRLPERVLRYLASSPPEGQRHAELLFCACQYRDAGIDRATAERELVPRAVAYGQTQVEALHDVASAYGKPARQPIRSRDEAPQRRPAPAIAKATRKPPAVAANLDNPPELPDPLPDGFRLLLETCFAEGENVGITFCDLDGDGKSRPKDRGQTFSREWILAKLAEAGGDVAKLWSSSDNAGLLVRINPMQDGGATDADVASFRHVLVECDGLELEKQVALFKQSELPIAALIYSGARSIHALVRVDAADAREYAERVAYVFGALEKHGVDPATRNPSRHTRVPGVARAAGRQELLAVNIGRKTFDEWQQWLEVETEISPAITLTQLAEFRASTDPDCLIGERFLCKGGTCFIVGQSGLGKSSFCMQSAIQWAMGEPLLGVPDFLQPTRRLKSTIIQSENDLGDLAEAYQGVLKGMAIDLFDETQRADLQNYLTFRRDTVHTGEEFARIAARIIEKDKPDLVWVDPTLAFFGDDMKDQKAVSRFFRQLLTPIAEATGIVWMMLHHTGKPSRNPKEAWNEDDFAYLGTGSSEQTNWARATMAILGEKDAPGIYKLLLGKRWKRAGLKGDDALPARTLYMKHGTAGICWQKSDYRPLAPATKGKVEKYEANYAEILDKLREPKTRAEIIEIICEVVACNKRWAVSKHWPALHKRLYESEGKFSRI